MADKQEQETIADTVADLAAKLSNNSKTANLELTKKSTENAKKPEPSNVSTQSAPGNAAKLREAVKSLIDIAEEDCIVRKLELGDLDVTVEKRRRMIAAAKAGLAAPPRNCDRFANGVQAWCEWLAFCKWKKGTPQACSDCVCVRDGGKASCFAVWLFSTAYVASKEEGDA